MPREQARAALGLDPAAPCLLFAADPARPEKRHDRAAALAAQAGVPLLTLGGVEPADVALSINAANAVLVPSEREGFGLAVLEALACDVPVLATPVGIHAEALAELPGTLCAPFELDRWSEALAPLLAERDPRVAGRARAERWSAERMAAARRRGMARCPGARWVALVGRGSAIRHDCRRRARRARADDRADRRRPARSAERAALGRLRLARTRAQACALPA